MRRILVALALASLPAVIAAQNATAPNNVANDRLNLDLYWEYETVSDPQLSPDSAQIIYTRGWIDKINDKRESSLWVMNADGSKNRFLVRGGNARWSPNGDRIVYTAQGDPKGSQIFVRYMDAEGSTSQITHLTESPANVTWSPDGQSIAFAMKVEKKTAWPIKMPERPEGAKWIETPRIVERLDYRQDGQGFNDDGFRHLFTVPATGGTPRQLTNGDWDHNGIEFTPDGKQDPFYVASGSRCRLPVARIGNLFGQRRQRRDRAIDEAQGSRQQPEGLTRRQARRLYGHRRVT
jgi:dipeptidyl aminopeptidase/acylaminoacyl peptidase